LSLGLIVVIFVISFWYAREHERRGRKTKSEQQAHALLTDEEPR
jgi:hypothetical protein